MNLKVSRCSGMFSPILQSMRANSSQLFVMDGKWCIWRISDVNSKDGEAELFYYCIHQIMDFDVTDEKLYIITGDIGKGYPVFNPNIETKQKSGIYEIDLETKVATLLAEQGSYSTSTQYCANSIRDISDYPSYNYINGLKYDEQNNCLWIYEHMCIRKFDLVTKTFVNVFGIPTFEPPYPDEDFGSFGKPFQHQLTNTINSFAKNANPQKGSQHPDVKSVIQAPEAGLVNPTSSQLFITTEGATQFLKVAGFCFTAETDDGRITEHGPITDIDISSDLATKALVITCPPLPANTDKLNCYIRLYAPNHTFSIMADMYGPTICDDGTPSSGMDYISKKYVWKKISDVSSTFVVSAVAEETVNGDSTSIGIFLQKNGSNCLQNYIFDRIVFDVNKPNFLGCNSSNIPNENVGNVLIRPYIDQVAFEIYGTYKYLELNNNKLYSNDIATGIEINESGGNNNGNYVRLFEADISTNLVSTLNIVSTDTKVNSQFLLGTNISSNDSDPNISFASWNLIGIKFDKSGSYIMRNNSYLENIVNNSDAISSQTCDIFKCIDGKAYPLFHPYRYSGPPANIDSYGEPPWLVSMHLTIRDITFIGNKIFFLNITNNSIIKYDPDLENDFFDAIPDYVKELKTGIENAVQYSLDAPYKVSPYTTGISKMFYVYMDIKNTYTFTLSSNKSDDYAIIISNFVTAISKDLLTLNLDNNNTKSFTFIPRTSGYHLIDISSVTEKNELDRQATISVVIENPITVKYKVETFGLGRFDHMFSDMIDQMYKFNKFHLLIMPQIEAS